MAFEDIRHAIGWWIAGADLSTHQFKFVELDSNGAVVLAGAAGQDCLGVLLNKPKSGESCQIADIGGGSIVKVVASAAIALEARVSSAADGRAVTAVATHHVLGKALLASAAAGEIIPVALRYGGIMA
jgi:hypothetical protein